MIEHSENSSSDKGVESEVCLILDNSISTDLYGELQNTAMVFQKLALRLQDKILQKNTKAEKEIQTDGCCEETRTRLMECIAENIRLKQNLRDVSHVNRSWQSYNINREKYIQQLRTSLSVQKRAIDAQNMASKLYATNLCNTKNRLKSEGPKTTTFYEELVNENQRLTKSMNDTRRMMIALEQQLEACKEDRNMLMIQLKTYRDDWEVEREEKNEALCEVQRISNNLKVSQVNLKNTAQRSEQVKYGLSAPSDAARKIQTLKCDASSIYCKTRPKSRRSCIVCSVDGVQIHLQERNSGELMDSEANWLLEKASNDPIVTFPDSESSGSSHSSFIQEETILEASRELHLVCPTCSRLFQNQCESQFLDHYIDCKGSLKASSS